MNKNTSKSKTAIRVIAITGLLTLCAAIFTVINRPFTENAVSESLEPICPPNSIKVIYPNGGEVWQKERTYKIRWDADSCHEEVRIMLKGGGDSRGGWFTVAFNTPNDGEFEHSVPVNYGYEKFRIFVRSLDNSIEDASDHEFFARRTNTFVPSPTHTPLAEDGFSRIPEPICPSNSIDNMEKKCQR